jgi:hypothetical protein
LVCAFRLQCYVIWYNHSKYYEKSLSGVGYTELPSTTLPINRLAGLV